jgi:hypothetical protein
VPHDYRGDPPRRQPAKRRPRQPVTVTRIAPAPPAPVGPLGPYTPEHRAAYYVQGVTRPADARELHDAGVGPDDLIAWTATGIPLDGYARMARFSRAGLTPAQYARWVARGMGGPVDDGAVVELHTAGLTPEQSVAWNAVRHTPTCGTRPIAGIACYCPAVGPAQIASLVRYGKTPAWLGEAIAAGCPNGQAAVLIAYKNVPLSLVRVVANRRSAHRGADATAVTKEWGKWVQSAGGDEALAQAVADGGGRRGEVRRWVQVALPPDRVRLLVRAGYGPDEALSPDLAALDDEALEVLASLLSLGDGGGMLARAV